MKCSTSIKSSCLIIALIAEPVRYCKTLKMTTTLGTTQLGSDLRFNIKTGQSCSTEEEALQDDSQQGPSFGGLSSYFDFLLPRSKEMVCISSGAWSTQKITALRRAPKLDPSSDSCIQRWGMGIRRGNCSSHRLRKCFPQHPFIPRGCPQPRHRAMVLHSQTLGLPGDWFKETRKFGRE